MDEVLTVGATEAARLLGCSKAHIYNSIDRGQLPVVNIGGRKLIPLQVLKDLVARATRPQEVRCEPCWMLAHVRCERGACTCTDEFHKYDESERELRLVEDSGALSTAEQAG